MRRRVFPAEGAVGSSELETRNPKHTAARGFTLVEMLVAVALLGMIASLLFFSLDQVSRATASGLGKATMYQDLRTVADQMSRELQQAIPYLAVNSLGITNSIFIGNTEWPQDSTPSRDAEMHFVATIDNNTGYEEVEVHYWFDGTNVLWKSLVYYGGTNASSAWDFNMDMAFDTSSTGIPAGSWPRTPLRPPDDMTSYAPVLTGVKSCCFQFSSDGAALTNVGPTRTWFAHREVIPSYVKVNLAVFDAAVLRRWGSADKVPPALTNLARTSTFFVQLPRSNE